jgi:hydrogenase maturation protein HypF
LGGEVCNDSEGVLVEVEGPVEALDELTRRLVDDAPPLARVSRVEVTPLSPTGDATALRIVESRPGAAPAAAVSVDVATCDDCLAEVADPCDRRFEYPFTNCTNCGPRYTIIRGIPYDRPATTMAGFPMCPACTAEYHDPADRRFHAQPNACPVCGPHLRLLAPDGKPRAERGEALAGAAGALLAGEIVAVKGLGGYHLAALASDDEAVAKLRRRKHRDDKPFAVMVANLEIARSLGELSPAAKVALASARRPIVLAPRRAGADLAHGVAPGLPELGLMLPYTPLHHLLLARVGCPLVMTSGNASDEPIAHIDDDAVARLGPMADAILTHDRPIHIRCDDSVVRSRSGGDVQMVRRSRGYAPEPLALPGPARRQVLAVGAELKNTVAVAKDRVVVASHHIGDLEHLATYRSFLQAVDHLCQLYGVMPEMVAHDLHPEYLSTKLAGELDLPLVGVQHHHAHVASCLTEHGRAGPVLGLAFDGTGYGTDGTLWGGELLVADLRGFERVGHLAPITMPGGVAAIREPWRMGLAWAQRAQVGDPFNHDPRHDAVLDLATRGQGPVTTSMGRLFDAVAALLGLRPTVSYEAQAAIELEALARSVPRAEASTYPVDLGRDATGTMVIDPAPLVAALVTAKGRGTAPALLAAAFHESIGRAAATAAIDVARERGLATVALTGGVFQNPHLSEVVEEALDAAGLEVLVHRIVPPNDGGISIGQAAVAAAQS